MASSRPARPLAGVHPSPSPALSALAAQHFVDAGIPHVVCSPLRLRDAAAAAFTRGLYMALAVGKTVAQSFAIAQECVRCAPRMPPEEADKFVLLPRDRAHDVRRAPAPSNHSAAAPQRPLCLLATYAVAHACRHR